MTFCFASRPTVLKGMQKMKREFLFLMSLLTAAAMSVPSSAFGSFIVTPTSGVLNTTRWEIAGNTNLDAAAVSGIVNVTPLVSRYKSDVSGLASGLGSDSGSFAASYNTVFSQSATDPADAEITWVITEPFINYTKVFLLLKDGNQTPGNYIFDISRPSGINGGWDGKLTIKATGFWPNKGAISHIEIFSNNTTGPGGGSTPIPEPTSLAIFATGLFCLVSRRFRR
jgi:PEP-CTERM motif